jgi:hypothetical protein
LRGGALAACDGCFGRCFGSQQVGAHVFELPRNGVQRVVVLVGEGMDVVGSGPGQRSVDVVGEWFGAGEHLTGVSDAGECAQGFEGPDEVPGLFPDIGCLVEVVAGVGQGTVCDGGPGSGAEHFHGVVAAGQCEPVELLERFGGFGGSSAEGEADDEVGEAGLQQCGAAERAEQCGGFAGVLDRVFDVAVLADGLGELEPEVGRGFNRSSRTARSYCRCAARAASVSRPA